MAARLENQVTQRPERDAHAVWEASAGQNRHFRAETSGDLPDEPRLSESCLADHGDGHRHSLTGGPDARAFEAAHLLVATYQGSIETERQRTHASVCG